MIGRLTGRLVECSPEQVLLEVAGVGYLLQIPLSTYYALSGGDGSNAGQAVSLHVHTHVREDALRLFGFAVREEREVFELLIGISGVGPRMALAILSGIGAGELRQAVLAQDRGRLEQIPGIGKKTAERLLLELRDRLARGPGRRAAPGAAPGPGGTGPGELRDDAVSALVNLGYKRERADRAVTGAIERLPVEEASLEAVLRAALGGLVR